MSHWTRRGIIKNGLLGAAALALSLKKLNAMPPASYRTDNRFNISLAQWSLHRTIRSGSLDHLDFAATAAGVFGIYGVEYVNQFFKDKATDMAYLDEMNRRAGNEGVAQLLIMVDGEGGLAEPDDQLRKTAIENHYKWADAAKVLGCHSIRVNAYGNSSDAVALHAAAVDGLSTLALYGASLGINVIVENHGGLSSNGKWLAGVMKEINLPNCGTLPDFGNFCLKEGTDQMGQSGCIETYDRYLGVEELAPYAKAMSAKTYDFDADGNETTIDYRRMIAVVSASGYEGYLGIEYEGSRLEEKEGILATKRLLERLI